ncbi:MAG: T9SS type A sorting domain-containing protein, partial [Candidatus Poribacteria bacterium]|nr:T9SS type A sorting domain-containing protein [Candidatus Poribacteria bacterium]
NYPNPFNPETWLPYRLAVDANVTLTIYDIGGAPVRRLEMGRQRAGYYTDRGNAAHWDGRNGSGERVASGIYFYELATPSFRDVRRMLIVK